MPVTEIAIKDDFVFICFRDHSPGFFNVTGIRTPSGIAVTQDKHMFAHQCRNNLFSARQVEQDKYECCNCHKVLEASPREIDIYTKIAAII